MKPRTCFLWLWIANDAGQSARYTVKPLSAAERALSVAAFRLVNQSVFPNPAYTVRLAVDGQVSCSCPQHSFGLSCKHADALVAAGLLPSQLVGLLSARDKLIDEATAMLQASEAECQRLAELHMSERTVYEHDAKFDQERIDDLTATVANLNDQVARLKAEAAARPVRRPRRDPLKLHKDAA